MMYKTVHNSCVIVTHTKKDPRSCPLLPTPSAKDLGPMIPRTHCITGSPGTP